MEVTCPCGTTFSARNRRARYCSDRCRKRAQRAPAVVEALRPDAPEPATGPGPIETAAQREFEEAAVVESSRAQAALALARRLDTAHTDTGSGVAALSREFGATLAAALSASRSRSAPLQLQDELAARRLAQPGRTS